MAADDQKGETALTDGEPVAEYIARQIPFPPFQDTAPRATNEARLGDMAEPTDPRRWNDAPIVQRHPFEVYVAGQPSEGAWPVLRCAWGTIGSFTNATEEIAITNRTADLTVIENDLIWLEVVFDVDGTITAAELKFGTPDDYGWDVYPVMFETVTGGNYWYHPIADIRPISTFESGFLKVHTVSGTHYRIAQHERNHLRPVRMCNLAGDNYWMLQPGPGGPAT